MHKKAIAKNLLVGQYCANCAVYSDAHYTTMNPGLCCFTWVERDCYESCNFWIRKSKEMEEALKSSFQGQTLALSKVIDELKICVKNEFLPIFRWKKRRKKND